MTTPNHGSEGGGSAQYCYVLIQDRTPVTNVKSYLPIGVYDTLAEGLANLYCDPALNSLYVIEKNPFYRKTAEGAFVGDLGTYYYNSGLKYLERKTGAVLSVDERTLMNSAQRARKNANLQYYITQKKDGVLRSNQSTIRKIEETMRKARALRTVLSAHGVALRDIMVNIDTSTSGYGNGGAPMPMPMPIDVCLERIHAFYDECQKAMRISAQQYDDDPKIQSVIKFDQLNDMVDRYYSALKDAVIHRGLQDRVADIIPDPRNSPVFLVP